MKRKSVIFSGVLMVVMLGLLSSNIHREPAAPAEKSLNAPITMCGTFLVNWEDTTSIQTRILPGLGTLHFSVTTASPQAQEFFDQGLRLIYGFNHWEAIQSFRQAVKLDPGFAMAYWGLALAYGPNLNDVNPKERERLAFDAIQKAVNKKGNTTPFEKDFIEALSTRYNGRAYDLRDSLNQAYASAMIKLANKYPDQAEAQTLCADAIMNTMPWDYWEKNGNPRAATIKGKTILEKTLKKFPNHPGAHHLYIHLVEASLDPELALTSAKFLETAMPGAGHIVHMPSHIYLRVGDYDKSLQLNERAAVVDEQYLSASDNQGLYRLMYYPHNIDFISFSGYMEGRSEVAMRAAIRLAYKGSLVVGANPAFAQYLMAEPLIAYTRFGKWTEILSLPAPDPDLIYLQVIWRFSRGMAFLRTDKLNLAQKELIKLDSLCSMDTLKSVYFSFNAASDIVQIPLHLLKGEVLLKQKNIQEGINTVMLAVNMEDGLRYNEPPDWKIFSRHYLGSALFDAGKFAEAEKIFLEDLKRNRENGWALKGLEICQQKLNNRSGSMDTGKRFSKAWKNADMKIISARF